MVVRAVHGPQHVGLAHRLAVGGFLDDLHGRIHVVLVVGQMAGAGVEIRLRDVRRRDALVAGLELELHGELLQLVADDRAIREPQRQSAADVVVDHE